MSQNKMKHLFSLIIALLLATAGLQAQNKLPSVTLETLKGDTINTTALQNGGKPLVIIFFATWCKPCMSELKALKKAYPTWKKRTGVRMIAVSIDGPQTVGNVATIAKNGGWKFEVMLDRQSRFAQLMDVQMVPHMIILDGEGNIADVHTDFTAGHEEQIYKKIRAVVKTKPSTSKK